MQPSQLSQRERDRGPEQKVVECFSFIMSYSWPVIQELNIRTPDSGYNNTIIYIYIYHTCTYSFRNSIVYLHTTPHNIHITYMYIYVNTLFMYTLQLIYINKLLNF